MTIPVPCSCGKKLKAPDSLSGKQAKCPDCGAILSVPDLASALPTLSEAPPENTEDSKVGGTGGASESHFPPNRSPSAHPPLRPAIEVSSENDEASPQTPVQIAAGRRPVQVPRLSSDRRAKGGAIPHKEKPKPHQVAGGCLILLLIIGGFGYLVNKFTSSDKDQVNKVSSAKKKSPDTNDDSWITGLSAVGPGVGKTEAEVMSGLIGSGPTNFTKSEDWGYQSGDLDEDDVSDCPKGMSIQTTSRSDPANEITKITIDGNITQPYYLLHGTPQQRKKCEAKIDRIVNVVDKILLNIIGTDVSRKDRIRQLVVNSGERGGNPKPSISEGILTIKYSPNSAQFEICHNEYEKAVLEYLKSSGKH